MKKRKVFCGWCSMDVGDGHSSDCPRHHHLAKAAKMTELEQLRAEVARLREALANCEHNLHGVASEQRRAWKMVIHLREALGGLLEFAIHPTFDAKAEYSTRKSREWVRLQELARAALSTPADVKGMEDCDGT